MIRRTRTFSVVHVSCDAHSRACSVENTSTLEPFMSHLVYCSPKPITCEAPEAARQTEPEAACQTDTACAAACTFTPSLHRALNVRQTLPVLPTAACAFALFSFASCGSLSFASCGSLVHRSVWL